MAAENKPPDAQPQGEAALQGGSYEVIRERLTAQGNDLGARTEALNGRRKALFGGTELQVIGSERVRTEHSCVPRDLVGIGPHLLLGYNVFLGLKTSTQVSDVFSLHRAERTAEGHDLSAIPASAGGGFLTDPRFVKEFQELYAYYKGTRLLGLARSETRLLALFQIGDQARDLKVFRFSLDAEGNATYLDNRGERDVPSPPTHDFEWTQATREHFVRGKHPHVNVLDQLFVETVGGDLTVKIENNTETGRGIYSEPVEDLDQSLDDGEVHFARLGALILLKIRPFREQAYRYLVFNVRTERVVRIDALGEACVQLPEDQGIVFPGGTFLQTGEHKLFDGEVSGLKYRKAIRSPNGEDLLYVFHRPDDGRYLLLPYNLVRKEVATPIACHGFSLFADGRMVIFRSTSDEPARVHPVQIWQTPFVSAEHAAAAPTDGSYLARVGNADLVRGISDAFTIRRLVESAQPTRKTYEALISTATRVIDSYPWLNHAEVGLLGSLQEIRATAELVVDEFEKVVQLRRRAAEALAAAAAAQERLTGALRPQDFRAVEPFLEALTALRRQRGELIALRELRHVDLPAIDLLEQGAIAAFDLVSAAAVEFLQRDEALRPLAAKLTELLGRIGTLTRTAEAAPLALELDATHAGLTVLGEIVSGLEVGDPTVRAGILEGLGDVFASLNRVRATLAARRKELAGREGRAEFGAQFKLFAQAVDSALSVAETPERCDEQLARLQLQLEELEGRFGELDDFLARLQEKREELLSAFDGRKQALLDERQRRAQNLFGAAERILAGVTRKAATLKDEPELQGYFAADAMVQKLRQLAAQLLALGDSVKADEALSRLKAAQQEALRGLRDRKELFEDGAAVIRLGEHRFHVNTRPLELTALPGEDGLQLHLTGTDFHEPITAAGFEDTRGFWDQHLASETAEVYRGEFLAGSILLDAEDGGSATGITLAKLQEAALSPGGLASLVRGVSAGRYDEGYERGLHDADAAAILERLLALRATAGLLRFPSGVRALACLFWAFQEDEAARQLWLRRAGSLQRLRGAFAHSPEVALFAGELGDRVALFLGAARIEHGPAEARLCGRYLAEELLAGARFTTSAAAVALKDALLARLDGGGGRRELEEDLRSLEKHLPERFALARAWLQAFVEEGIPEAERAAVAPLVSEAAVLLLTDRKLTREITSALTATEVSGLLGAHGRISGGKLALRLDEFVARLGDFLHRRVPGYRAYRGRLKALLEEERHRLRLEELTPRVLTSFVRNRLIGELYLPLIGKNLAKQLGAAGEGKRTDRMGLLLLLSPPGYGKTTLMEYVASRLGLVFVKVNGPALGHGVTSLDPAEAQSATARQEVERINLGLELGNNVMLYLDDIQHCSSELLQKFISLCDGQRRIEGVWKGRTRTHDLRGKKFCVVMAGNPYTESGERFRIPDMLANRADTYNLGDVLGGKQELFALSYLENSLTSNPVLAPLAGRDPKDVQLLIRLARGEEVQTTELAHGYAGVELQEIVAVLARCLKLQRVLALVNAQYIASAAQDDRFRTEPAFKLQGSYRNMNKLAEKVVAALSDEELERLIDDHYAAESGTLTSGAEHNLLKLAELRGRLHPEQRARWEEIKRGFQRVQLAGGSEEDPVARVVGSLALVGDQLAAIRAAVAEAAAAAPVAPAAPEPERAAAPSPVAELLPKLDELREAVLAVARAGAATATATAASVEAARRVPPPIEPPRIAAPAPQQAAPAEPLGPYLARLDEVLRLLARNNVATAPARAGKTPRAPVAAPLLPASSDVEKQLVLIEHALMPLARAAQRNLQAGEGSIKAIKVWQRVSEALELVRVLLPPDHDPSRAAATAPPGPPEPEPEPEA